MWLSHACPLWCVSVVKGNGGVFGSLSHRFFSSFFLLCGQTPLVYRCTYLSICTGIKFISMPTKRVRSVTNTIGRTKNWGPCLRNTSEWCWCSVVCGARGSLVVLFFIGCPSQASILVLGNWQFGV